MARFALRLASRSGTNRVSSRDGDGGLENERVVMGGMDTWIEGRGGAGGMGRSLSSSSLSIAGLLLTIFFFTTMSAYGHPCFFFVCTRHRRLPLGAPHTPAYFS